MIDPKFRRLRVLHLVGADYYSAPNPLLLPLLTRGNRQRIESQVVHFVQGAAQFAVVRQSGLPVHEVALSSKRFSPAALFELKKIIKDFHPDVIHAWGSAAQFAAVALSGDKAPIVWSTARTTPLASKAKWMEKTLFNWNKKFAPRMSRIVYSSAVAGAQHRRVGLPEELGTVIAPGVDADRFKPDAAARQKVREQLELPKEAILVGMYAPFQPEFDYGTMLKAVGELIRTNQNLYCVVGGRGVVRGNAALMAMVGGGTLGGRTRVIGEWSDLNALFNACDVVCSSATTDNSRLLLAIAMLCGVVCVATGVGAQGEVIGNFGISVEPNSATALAKGIHRVLELPAERRAFMQQEARKHVLQNFNMTRSIERYHELYAEICGASATASSDTPTTSNTPPITAPLSNATIPVSVSAVAPAPAPPVVAITPAIKPASVAAATKPISSTAAPASSATPAPAIVTATPAAKSSEPVTSSVATPPPVISAPSNQQAAPVAVVTTPAPVPTIEASQTETSMPVAAAPIETAEIKTSAPTLVVPAETVAVKASTPPIAPAEIVAAKISAASSRPFAPKLEAPDVLEFVSTPSLTQTPLSIAVAAPESLAAASPGDAPAEHIVDMGLELEFVNRPTPSASKVSPAPKAVEPGKVEPVKIEPGKVVSLVTPVAAQPSSLPVSMSQPSPPPAAVAVVDAAVTFVAPPTPQLELELSPSSSSPTPPIGTEVTPVAASVSVLEKQAC